VKYSPLKYINVGDIHSISKELHKLLTCAVNSIAIKSIVACAYKTTNHISTGGILMAVVYAQFTLINVCM